MAHRTQAHSDTLGGRFLDPKVLARIDNLDLLARTVVDGFLHGLHKSPYLGLSMEFAEHRAYMPGDDIRKIDWRLFARTDRHYVKQYEAETNANFTVLLDVSRSMSYGSGPITKLDYARFLAASLTYFSRRQRDRVGLYAFDSEVVEHVRPSVRHLDQVLHALERVVPGRPGALGPSLFTAASTFRRKGIVALVSDFYESPDAVVDAIRPLVGSKHDLVVFHVLDQAELEFPFEKPASFEDLETGERFPVVPEKLRDGYRQVMREHVAEIQRRVLGQGAEYTLIDTSQPLDLALFRYLLARQKARTSRGPN
ncbi:MAG: DUF58 domain-containing protein [Gemmatimonadetes bacterium]|nr:DUF58 domain-containing protein [Gemmatimonadota bacterium]